jgi:hypothetical protein
MGQEGGPPWLAKGLARLLQWREESEGQRAPLHQAASVQRPRPQLRPQRKRCGSEGLRGEECQEDEGRGQVGEERRGERSISNT